MSSSNENPRKKLTAAVIVAVGMFSFSSAAVADLASEREALLEIYNATGGNGWLRSDTRKWNSAASICQWDGVSCNPAADTVTSLALANVNMTGELPDNFTGLPNLDDIDFRDNHLTGTLPASMGELSLLKNLRIQRNALVGDVTATLTPMLERGGSVSLEYNGLYSADGSLNGLISRFPSTQTLDAEVVNVGQIVKTAATVTWIAVDLTEPGGYIIEFTDPEGGVVAKTINGKSTVQAEVVGLTPGVEYSVVVRSFTNVHGQNNNIIRSDGKRFAGSTITTEDNDSDGDGFGDIAEGKNLQPATDSDNDGIPDYLDDDDDNDGVKTVDEFDGDTDGDGTDDRLDNDDDNDGIPTIDELPIEKDENQNGVADYLEAPGAAPSVLGTEDPEDPEDPIGFVETSIGGGSFGFGLLLLGFLGLARRSRVSQSSALLLVLLLSVNSVAADEDNQDRKGRYYAGFSAGSTEVEPGTSNSGIGLSVSENQDAGAKIVLGYEMTNRLAVELFHGLLGEAELAPRGKIDYETSGIALAFTPLGRIGGFSPVFKLGVDRINNNGTNVRFTREEDILAYGAIGLEYEFSNAWALRGEFDYFAEDAQMLSLGLVKKFSRKSAPIIAQAPAAAPTTVNVEPQVIIKTIEIPVPAPAPAVVQPAPAPVIQIPDSDGDGVSDVGDKCPNSPAGATIDNMGCAIFQGNLKGVNFETNSASLTSSAQSILDTVAAELEQFPAIKIEVQAHTDSVGDAGYNQRLSAKRAKSVIGYLSSKGIRSSRMIPVGYGERTPIATNLNEAGRAENRRVVFVVR